MHVTLTLLKSERKFLSKNRYNQDAIEHFQINYRTNKTYDVLQRDQTKLKCHKY